MSRFRPIVTTDGFIVPSVARESAPSRSDDAARHAADAEPSDPQLGARRPRVGVRRAQEMLPTVPTEPRRPRCPNRAPGPPSRRARVPASAVAALTSARSCSAASRVAAARLSASVAFSAASRAFFSPEISSQVKTLRRRLLAEEGKSASFKTRAPRSSAYRADFQSAELPQTKTSATRGFRVDKASAAPATGSSARAPARGPRPTRFGPRSSCGRCLGARARASSFTTKFFLASQATIGRGSATFGAPEFNARSRLNVLPDRHDGRPSRRALAEKSRSASRRASRGPRQHSGRPGPASARAWLRRHEHDGHPPPWRATSQTSASQRSAAAIRDGRCSSTRNFFSPPASRGRRRSCRRSKSASFNNARAASARPARLPTVTTAVVASRALSNVVVLRDDSLARARARRRGRGLPRPAAERRRHDGQHAWPRFSRSPSARGTVQRISTPGRVRPDGGLHWCCFLEAESRRAVGRVSGGSATYSPIALRRVARARAMQRCGGTPRDGRARLARSRSISMRIALRCRRFAMQFSQCARRDDGSRAAL